MAKKTKHQILQDLEDRGLARFCRQCGNMLKTLRKDAIYCSNRCRSIATNARNRDIIKQFKESKNATKD